MRHTFRHGLLASVSRLSIAAVMAAAPAIYPGGEVRVLVKPQQVRMLSEVAPTSEDLDFIRPTGVRTQSWERTMTVSSSATTAMVMGSTVA